MCIVKVHFCAMRSVSSRNGKNGKIPINRAAERYKHLTLFEEPMQWWGISKTKSLKRGPKGSPYSLEHFHLWWNFAPSLFGQVC